ncbi:PadR family transcriptional regulator [Haloarcula quadrata]|uniref:PadR family transcriptional regulator n=1 Tax=Haloarcula quadrata TaxID=182779 RepID=A0A495QQE3_9EURY|nr:helix-turn-helix transcriptional regulator [Haloarcula quadrata]RKS75187.1 PadR family transcriptional regulator [Haloarcula quadrata]
MSESRLSDGEGSGALEEWVELTATERRILAEISKMEQEDWAMWGGAVIDAVGEQHLSVSDKQVYRVLSKLVDRGWLVDLIPDKRTSRYALTPTGRDVLEAGHAELTAAVDELPDELLSERRE